MSEGEGGFLGCNFTAATELVCRERLRLFGAVRATTESCGAVACSFLHGTWDICLLRVGWEGRGGEEGMFGRGRSNGKCKRKVSREEHR
jgi:hypothetical protein